MRLASVSAAATSSMCALSLAFGGLAVDRLVGVNDGMRHLQQQSATQHGAVAQVRTDFSDYVSATRGWALVAATSPGRKDVLDRQYASAQATAAAFRRDLDATAALVRGDQAALEQLQQLDTQMYAYTGYGIQAHVDLESGNASGAATLLAQSDVTWCSRCATYTGTLGDLSSVDDAISSQTALRSAALQQRQRLYETLAALALGATLALVVAAWVAFRRAFLRPIVQLQRHIAASNTGLRHLTSGTSVAKRRDELGALADAYETFAVSVHDVLTEVSDASRRLGSTAARLAELSIEAADRNEAIALEVASLSQTAGRWAGHVHMFGATGETVKASSRLVAYTAYEAALVSAEVAELVATVDSGVQDLCRDDGQVSTVVEGMQRLSIMTRSLAAATASSDRSSAGYSASPPPVDVGYLASSSAEGMSSTIARIGEIQRALAATAEEMDGIRSVSRRMNEHAFMIAGAVNDHSEAADQLVEVARVASRDSERIRLAGHRVATAAQGARLAAEEADAYTEQLGSLASQLSGLTLRFTR